MHTIVVIIVYDCLFYDDFALIDNNWQNIIKEFSHTLRKSQNKDMYDFYLLKYFQFF
jgi:hypothetical protein